MDFIDADRLAARIYASPMGPVVLIAPGMGLRSCGYGRGGRTEFRREGEGVGFLRQLFSVRADDVEFVAPSFGDVGHEHLPDTDILAPAHHMPEGIPVVEIAHHGDPARIGSPDREVDAADTLVIDRVRAQLVVEPKMGALRHQQVVDRAQNRPEAVGICKPPFRAAAPGAVFHGLGRARDDPFEKPMAVDAGKSAQRLSLKIVRFRFLRSRYPNACKSPIRAGMRAEQREGIIVTAFQECFDGTRWRLHMTPQISCAYSRMVRSEENQPTFATLRTEAARQSAGLVQRRSTSRCAAW